MFLLCQWHVTAQVKAAMRSWAKYLKHRSWRRDGTILYLRSLAPCTATCLVKHPITLYIYLCHTLWVHWHTADQLEYQEYTQIHRNVNKYWFHQSKKSFGSANFCMLLLTDIRHIYETLPPCCWIKSICLLGGNSGGFKSIRFFTVQFNKKSDLIVMTTTTIDKEKKMHYY